MANSINSISTGTGGLQSTADGTSGNLLIQKDAGTIATFSSTGVVVSGVVAATTLTGDGSALTNLPSAGLNDYSKFVNSTEVITLTASAATGTLNFDTNTQLVQWYTTTATGNWILNVRASSGETLNSKLVVGQCITLVMIAATGTGTYYPTQLNIDGAAQTGTARTRWLGGAPTATAGAATTTAKVYTYTIVKTADAIFYTIASQSDYS